MGPATAPELKVFRSTVDTSFVVHLDAIASVDLRLVEVSTHDPRPGWESFSLLFVGPAPAVAQATYLVEHPTIGPFELFLVPVQLVGSEARYEAVFTRPVA